MSFVNCAYSPVTRQWIIANENYQQDLNKYFFSNQCFLILFKGIQRLLTGGLNLRFTEINVKKNKAILFFCKSAWVSEVNIPHTHHISQTCIFQTLSRDYSILDCDSECRSGVWAAVLVHSADPVMRPVSPPHLAHKVRLVPLNVSNSGQSSDKEGTSSCPGSAADSADGSGHFLLHT